MSLSRTNRIAWLVESSTAYGAATSVSTKPLPGGEGFEITEFRYPLHVSQVRNVYEQRRSRERAHTPVVAPVPGTASPLPFDAVDHARDIPAAMTPGITAVEVEWTLAAHFSAIERGGFHYVGITSTDIRDPIFLADKIRDYCPNVQLLFPYPDLLHAHPQYRVSLAGAIVAASYPLLADAQEWCYPFRYATQGPSDAPRPPVVVHSSQLYAGLYNAVILLRALSPPLRHQMNHSPRGGRNGRLNPCLRQSKLQTTYPCFATVHHTAFRTTYCSHPCGYRALERIPPGRSRPIPIVRLFPEMTNRAIQSHSGISIPLDALSTEVTTIASTFPI